MTEAGAPSTRGKLWHAFRGVPAPPEVVMVAPPEVPRNASRAQSEGHAGSGVEQKRGQGHYRGRGPTGPRPVIVLLLFVYGHPD